MFACWLCAVAAPSPAAAQLAPADVVAVFDIELEDAGTLGREHVKKVNDYLDAAVSSAGFATTPRAQIQAALLEQQAESFKACFDEACQIELGKSLAAQKVIGATWSRFGARCVLTLRLYDLRQAVAEFSATGTDECNEVGIRTAIDGAIEALRGHRQSQLSRLGRVRTLREPLEFKVATRNERPRERGFLVVRVKTTPVAGDLGDAGSYVDATVFIDGEEPVGTTHGSMGWSSAGPLIGGSHRVTAMYTEEYWAPAQTTVDIRDGQTTEIELELQPRFGLLDVTTTPEGAEIDIDGRRAPGATPIRGLRAPIGQVSIQLSHAEHLPARETLVLTAGKTTSVHRSLVSDVGSLRVTASPEGAYVAVDGTAVGMTPIVLSRTLSGRHRVDISRPGYASAGRIVDVTRGKATNLDLRLEPLLGRVLVTSLLHSAEGVADCRATVHARRDGLLVATATTPTELRDLLAVPHDIEVECAGVREERRIEVRHNDDVEVRFETDDQAVRAAKLAREQRIAEARRATERLEQDRLRARRYGACVEVHTRAWCEKEIGTRARSDFESGRITIEVPPKKPPLMGDTERTVSGIIVLAASAAALCGGIYSTVRANNIDGNLELLPSTANRSVARTMIEDGETAALTGDALIGGAIAGAAVGIFLLAF